MQFLIASYFRVGAIATFESQIVIYIIKLSFFSKKIGRIISKI